MRRRQGTLLGPGLQEARVDVRGPRALPAGREPAGRRVLWQPHQRDREGKRRVPDFKGRAGDREGSGAQEGSPAALRVRQREREGAHRGAPGPADPDETGDRGAGGSGTTGSRLETPEEGGGALTMPPARRCPLPWAGGRQGTGPEAAGGAVGPSPRGGESGRG